MSAQICNNCTNELKQERLKHDYEKMLQQNHSSTYNIDEFKHKYSNSFLYLTHLFRNGKLIFNEAPKKIKKEKLKNKKIINYRFKEIKQVNNENYIYNNRSDPYKEATLLWNLAKKNQKKYSSNEKFHKTFSAFEEILDKKNNEEKENQNKLKTFYATCVREGFYGKKNKDNIPLFFPNIITCLNEYSSKSEKVRHEKLLDEFGKLSFYLYQNPENKLKTIKDFLIKFHLVDINKYTNKQLLKLEKLVMKFNFMIEPYKDIKSMIRDTLDGKIKIINDDNKFVNYISPNIPKRKIRDFNTISVNNHLYKNMGLERQKKIYLNDINYDGNYNKILNDMEKEINFISDSKMSTISSKTEYGNFKFITSSLDDKQKKPNMILTNEKNIIKTKTATIQTSDRSRNKSKNSTITQITDRLYYKPMSKALGVDDIKKNGKLTEYVAYTTARNKIFENKLKNLFDE